MAVCRKVETENQASVIDVYTRASKGVSKNMEKIEMSRKRMNKKWKNVEMGNGKREIKKSFE